MEGAIVVIPLVALIFPILLLLAALLFDAAIALCVLFGELHDRPTPRVWRFARHPGRSFHWPSGVPMSGWMHR